MRTPERDFRLRMFATTSFFRPYNIAAASALVLAILLVCCFLKGKKSDDKQTENLVYHRLKCWAEYLEIALDQRRDLIKFRSSQEVLTDWKRIGMIDNWEYDEFLKDPWGTPYTWHIERSGGSILIRVGSAGRNRVWENGEGDDFYVDVCYRGPKQIEVFLKPIK